MRVAFLLRAHPPNRPSPIMPEVMRLLSERGVKVSAIYPDEQVTDLAAVRVEHDLYVLKSGTELALSLAGALDALGAAILNPYLVTERCRDKIVATRILQAAGVAVPATYAGGRPGQLLPLLEDGPIVVKPYRGSQGRGVQVVRGVADLPGVQLSGGLLFAQRFHRPQGRDRKIYRIGDEVFGVKRIWPAATYEDKRGEPYEVPPELRDLAWRCGRAFGMELYGLDVVMSGDGPYVVDISSFPGFKGVPDASRRLADYIHAAGLRASRGEPVIPEAEDGWALGQAAPAMGRV
jgi:ribosomal protein S6--L-glutamate ligase